MLHFRRRFCVVAGCLSLALVSCGPPATRVDGCDGTGCPSSDRDGAPGTDGGLTSGFDAGQADGGGGLAPDAGPVDAGIPSNWTWVSVPESACGNGAPTGYGVSTTENATELFIYLQGGGACWNSVSCQFAANNIKDGYGAAQFATDRSTRAAAFNRNAPANPIKAMNFVFVPYCTGDVHAGDNIVEYPAAGSVPARTVHHKGAKNLAAFLLRLKQTFPSPRRVFFAGSSAGAYGAQFNYARVAATWPNAEVHMLADSGQMVNPTGGLLTEWIANWNMTLPSDCAGCAQDFSKFPLYLHNKFPNRRFALLAFTQDNTLRNFAGYDAQGFETATRALLAADYATTMNAKYFLVAGSSHVMLGGLNTVSTNGVTLLSWTRAFVGGEAGWVSVGPP